MALVRAGWFTMGPVEGRVDPRSGLSLAAATHSRQVRLDAFYVDLFEVSNAMYDRFCSETRHRPRVRYTARSPDFDVPGHPVVGVSFADALAYCRWAGKRLPTEDEWERAARGTDGRRYPWGNDDPGKRRRANFRDRSNARAEAGIKGGPGDPLDELRQDDGVAFTAPVEAFPDGASPCGALNMAGNVWEWCLAVHGGGPCVTRGGSWRNQTTRIGCTSREQSDPEGRSNSVGFRCVLSAR